LVRIYSSTTWPSRIFWCVVVLSCLSLFMIHNDRRIREKAQLQLWNPSFLESCDSCVLRHPYTHIYPDTHTHPPTLRGYPPTHP
uniref:Secreted protein n=1 Tax=Angiostrongylus cantonensis TaxID=6313 RepID=A0A0K0CVY4_ANGCA